jgi:hypothetical protein
MSRLRSTSTTKSPIENDQERNNINLKYSQNSQMIIVLKVLWTIVWCFVDEGTLVTLKLHLW